MGKLIKMHLPPKMIMLGYSTRLSFSLRYLLSTVGRIMSTLDDWPMMQCKLKKNRLSLD